MSDISLQKRLLELVQQQIPDKLSVIYELSELLNISSDSVYRRLREETLLDINEIEKICNHFHISFDTLLNITSTDTSLFNFSPIVSTGDFIHYLYFLKKLLEELSQNQQSHIYYAAIDLPILHNFKFPLVSMFKSFYWLKAISNDSNFHNVKFSTSLKNTEILKLKEEMHQFYLKVPSTEIWTDQILNSLLKQIDYFWDSGEFNSMEDAINLLNEVEEEFAYLENAVCNCSKIVRDEYPLNNANFTVYLSDILINNNSILIENNNKNRAIICIHTYNILTTTNPVFISETKRWLNTFLKKSVLISGTGERQRFSFFHQAYEKIESIKKKINSTVNGHG